MKNKNWLITALILAALAVGFGAFGAHGLKKLVAPPQLDTFKTGVLYHFMHALGLALAVVISQFVDNRFVRASFRNFALGILCFSGSLYWFTFLEATGREGIPIIGLVTPLGGVFFITGWLWLAWGVYKHQPSAVSSEPSAMSNQQ
jgi:uncharacterized membrane protein YgdD (TMEM256/DUF423 family)